MTRINIPVDKIGTVIGPAGKTIRGIVDRTKATVDVQDDGTVTIGSPDAQAVKTAVKMIQDLTREVEIGEIYTGKVVKIATFGAFVEILPGRDGMVHISELANYRVPTVEDVVSVGDEITVIVSEIDSLGRINLSRRALLEGDSESQEGEAGAPRPQPTGQPGRPEGPDSRPSRPGEGRPFQSRGRPGGDRGGYRPQGGQRGGQGGGRRFGGGPPGRRPGR
jgi:polyribonucleotide nucleotidyltransferase